MDDSRSLSALRMSLTLMLTGLMTVSALAQSETPKDSFELLPWTYAVTVNQIYGLTEEGSELSRVERVGFLQLYTLRDLDVHILHISKLRLMDISTSDGRHVIPPIAVEKSWVHQWWNVYRNPHALKQYQAHGIRTHFLTRDPQLRLDPIDLTTDQTINVGGEYDVVYAKGAPLEVSIPVEDQVLGKRMRVGDIPDFYVMVKRFRPSDGGGEYYTIILPVNTHYHVWSIKFEDEGGKEIPYEVPGVYDPPKPGQALEEKNFNPRRKTKSIKLEVFPDVVKRTAPFRFENVRMYGPSQEIDLSEMKASQSSPKHKLPAADVMLKTLPAPVKSKSVAWDEQSESGPVALLP